MQSDKDSKEENKVSFIKDLLRRRVPQILGIYLGTSWAIIEFLDWIISRFPISPHLPDFAMVILASMLPTVLLLAYFHGKPGRDTWTRVEKIGIPTNVLGAVLFLFFLFKGEDLGATTTRVNLIDEEGQSIERIIPKSEFRKKIVLYFMNNESGDTELNWLCYGITDMLSTDLIQDHYIEVKTGYSFSDNSLEKAKEAGYKNLIGLPLLLEKEIADEMYSDYFLTGSFTKQDDIYSVNTKLYNTHNGKLINQNNFTDQSIFNLVDQISVKLKHDLDIPDYHIEEADDLPVYEISTKSFEAYKWYIIGANEITFNQDWNQGINYLSQSVQVDSTFAIAYLELYYLHLVTNQSVKGSSFFGPLMRHLYKLPEKIQLQAKASYFEFNQQFDKQYAIFEMLVKLFPEDINQRLNLIAFHKIRNLIDEAIEGYKYILELDPERHSIYKEIGALYTQKGSYKEALTYYDKYAEHFPDRPESFRSIGNLYKIMGNFEEAKSNYEKALILDQGNISDLINLSIIETNTGNFDQALIQFQDALRRSNTPEDKSRVYAQLQYYHELRGENKKALDYYYLKQDELKKYLTPINLNINKIYSIEQLSLLESESVVIQNLQALEVELDTLLKDMVSLGYLYLYLELKDIEQTENYVRKVEDFISKLKIEALQRVILHARSKIHEFRGEYDLAIQKYLEQLEQEPTNSSIYVNIGRCYRNLENYKKADDYIQKALTVNPFSPEANYEMALIHYEIGKSERAMKYLQTTLKIWENADPDFEHAILAREKLTEWSK